MMGSKAFENPLIPHARMRALYRALVETRVLGEDPRRKTVGWPRDLEACWVATALDLSSSDLVSLGGQSWLLEYVRDIGSRGGQAPSRAALVRLLRAKAAAQAEALPPMDRALCAVGMAQALKAAGSGLALCFLHANDLDAAEWKRLLRAAATGDLPLVILVAPASRTRSNVDLAKIARRVSTGIPVIPVDAGDAVAIYRVAQETAVRARADGGVAVLEAIACGTDPVALLGSQLVKKQICTERWVAAVEPGFRVALAKARP